MATSLNYKIYYKEVNSIYSFNMQTGIMSNKKEKKEKKNWHYEDKIMYEDMVKIQHTLILIKCTIS